MAEFVLSKLAESAVSQTVQRVSDLLIHEAASIRSVRTDVMLLEHELRSLLGFLRDADVKQEHDQRLRDLVIRVKDVADDVEDVIETYITKVTFSYMKGFHNKRIRTEINNIQIRIQSITRKTDFGEGTISTVELQRNLRRSNPNNEDDEEDNDVISLESSTAALKAELSSWESPLRIVSVAGMGGLGKTTLAKKVYNSMRQHFDCCAWVFISQQFVPRDVLIQILTQVVSPFEHRLFGRTQVQWHNLEQVKNEREILNTLKEYELIDLLREELKKKRYLVVLDDIWNIQAWDHIKSAFSRGKWGSKILFTSRNKEVATLADPLSSPIELPFLTLEASWELLKRKAFPRDTVGYGCCPPEFEELGIEMAKRCQGLPLALVVLGGLLKTKSSLDEWKKVLKDVNSHLNKLHSGQQYEGVREILSLSYYDLPYNLKPCFLYLGNFPEDYDIPKGRLVRLWIGEGFIPTPTRGETEQTLEDVAERFLEELIDRCMVQVTRRDSTGISVKTCRMHDLMRDLCTLKAKEERFAQIINRYESKMIFADSASSHHLGIRQSRRIVLHPGCNLDCKEHWLCNLMGMHTVNAPWVEQVHCHLRSVLCLGGTISMSALGLRNFRMLRVLELRVVGSKIAGGISNLIHLRYLRISAHGKRTILPASIGNLRNLHTLDLGYCRAVNLPRTISRLKRLRHLLLPCKLKLPRGSGIRIDELKDIETLKYVPSSTLTRYNALKKLTNLRNLGIKFDGITDDFRRVFESPIVESGCVRSLYMSCAAKGFTSLEPLSSCHSLTELRVDGKLSVEILNSNCRSPLQNLPASLTRLTLERSNLTDHDPMQVLEKLPNLMFLRLSSEMYLGSEMVCSANGFPKLKTLQLGFMRQLKKWTIQNGAMPCLKKLHIISVPNLEMTPSRLKFVITTLEDLNVDFMKTSFRASFVRSKLWKELLLGDSFSREGSVSQESASVSAW
ncbi:hypothetical protein FNV43_RR25186 [Rhamnella rubrinervis]|uniref:Uncharacterized protein n=1 Tax=Rhamnella rubrinervis TaxID=2594499 RepID=A0A8K0GRE1_9ROSA|nr:hypothetical protein FNV43_RR25186 [Rhamnella rubrinervis]